VIISNGQLIRQTQVEELDTLATQINTINWQQFISNHSTGGGDVSFTDTVSVIGTKYDIDTVSINVLANTGKDTTGIYHANRAALDLVSGTNTGDQSLIGYMQFTDTVSLIATKYDIDTLGFLRTEVDGSLSNEGSLTVAAGSATTSIINSNTSGQTGVTLTAGTGMTIAETGNTIILSTTAGGGNVSNTGTPLDNQIPIWKDATTVEGNSNLTYNGTTFTINGDLSLGNGSAAYMTFPDITAVGTPTSGFGYLWMNESNDHIYWENSVGSFDLTAGAAGMIYPGAGIALSTGTAWGTSITDNSTNWNTAFTNMHDAVTISTANGLSLSTQALSLALASTSTTGALSDTDWDNFNSKLSSEVDGSITNEIQTMTAGALMDLTPSGNDYTFDVDLTELGIDATAATADYIPWLDNITGQKKMLISTLETLVGGGWDANSGYVSPKTITDEVRIGSTSDAGDYKLQVTGAARIIGADLEVQDEVYSVAWNASTGVPTKNALYDKIETLVGGVSSINDLSDAIATANTELFFGTNSGGNNSGTNYNMGVGHNSLQSTTSGDANVGVGYDALKYATGASNGNVALGNESLMGDASGVYVEHTAIGDDALKALNTGEFYNTSLGARSLWRLSTGSQNVGIGTTTGGTTFTSGDNNIFLGYYAKPLNATENNSIVIGANATGKGSNTVYIGNSSITDTHLEGAVHTETQVNTVINGSKSGTWSHDAAAADLGAYTADSTTTAMVLQINNLESGAQGTIFIDIGASVPTSFTVNTFSDVATTGLTEVVLGSAANMTLNESTSVTYTCVNNGTATLVYLVYGQE
jgi:hypothetical protein